MKMIFLKRKRIAPNTIIEEQSIVISKWKDISPLQMYGQCVSINEVDYIFDRFDIFGNPTFVSYDIEDETDCVACDTMCVCR